jgi:hypothetical protein
MPYYQVYQTVFLPPTYSQFGSDDESALSLSSTSKRAKLLINLLQTSTRIRDGMVLMGATLCAPKWKRTNVEGVTRVLETMS